MKMTMNYEFITPEKAIQLLENNNRNRTISNATVVAYTNDILNNNWDEEVGSPISIDEKGMLRDGQHRLKAIIRAGKGIHLWVCRNVSTDGIYDNNRKRSNSDQINILRPDLEGIYRSPRYISLARTLIAYSGEDSMYRRPVTTKEIIDFTEKHKKDLDGFFLKIPQGTIAKVTVSVIFIGMFSAYMAGVSIESILKFYDILVSGMSTKQEEFPIIAYRNYLKDSQAVHTTIAEIARCQYAIKKYVLGSCVKRSTSPKELIYPLPYAKKKG